MSNDIFFDLLLSKQKQKSEFSEVFFEENHPNPQFFIIEWRPNLKLRSQPQIRTNFEDKFIFGLLTIPSIMSTIATFFKGL